MLQMWPSNKEAGVYYKRVEKPPLPVRQKRGAVAQAHVPGKDPRVDRPKEAEHDWNYQRGEGEVCTKCLAFRKTAGKRQARETKGLGYSSALSKIAHSAFMFLL